MIDREAFEDDRRRQVRRGVDAFEYGAGLIAQNCAHPADDMLSVVCSAARLPVRTSQLADQELQFFFGQPVVGGRRGHHSERDRRGGSSR